MARRLSPADGRRKKQRPREDSLGKAVNGKDVGTEVVDNNDNVTVMNNTEMIDKLNKESASKPMIPFIDIEVNSVCSEIWL